MALDQMRAALSAHASRAMQLFREWDEDGDGTISKREFRRAMRSMLTRWGLQPTRDDVDRLFDSLDLDSNGARTPR